MGEGDGYVGEGDGGIGVDCGDDDGPDGVLAPPEERGRETPFFFFLDLLPRWEKGFPSVTWPPWWRRGGSPSKIRSLSLSLCFLFFLRSQILAFHHFLNSRRSVTPIGLKF